MLIATCSSCGRNFTLDPDRPSAPCWSCRADAHGEACKTDPCPRCQAVAELARKLLGFKTLETRNMDSLDFRDCAVWSVREALEQAYDAGRRAAEGKA